MNKGSMIFKAMCLALCLALCLATLPAFAEEATVTDTQEVEAPAEEETKVSEENEETALEAPSEDVSEEESAAEEETIGDETEEPVEELDLYAATLRDNGIYVTPGEDNIAAFTYDGLRYKVAAETPNGIKLDGFEEDVSFSSDDLGDDVKNRLRATGEITVQAAHSGRFGLSVSSGEVLYRCDVEADTIYVFSQWVKIPSGGTISDSGRAYCVNGDSGTVYTVGANNVTTTDSWQQVIFTFKAPESGLFEISFEYRGSKPMYTDDLELYEAELFMNPLTIESVTPSVNGTEFDYSSGIPSAGTITHTTTFYNSDEDDVYYKAILVLYKNDIMVKCIMQDGCALVLDEAIDTLSVDIPEGEDLSQYKYMVYFISDTDPTLYYGDMPSRLNPYIAEGK